jgi:pyruvate,orthophosphate dikinase
MIMSGTEAERRAALDELFPFVKRDIKATLEVMGERPVTIRLLDPPLHEFVPTSPEERSKLASSLDISVDELDRRADELHEMNPMIGHRGVRLGITFPEISEMQFRAILEAAIELRKEGKSVFPEIMVPVTCVKAEIEIPRAALTADEIAESVEFFSFGTNDLTQMTFGFSRDDIAGFLPDYLDKKVLPVDPFQVLDRASVGRLVEIGIERGRSTRPELKVGICGEHGGEANSVEFCHLVGMDYVSCSPYRLPIARLAAAQAQIRHPR